MTDEDKIREMQALWAQRDTNRDADGWSSLYIPDGKYVNPAGLEFVGRAAIRQNLLDRYARRAPNERTTHVFGEMVIRINGDEARSAVDYIVCVRDGDNQTRVGSIGRHYARLVRHGEQWLFAEYRIVNHPDVLPPAPE
jgi:ketosteroid isomerase-like protein